MMLNEQHPETNPETFSPDFTSGAHLAYVSVNDNQIRQFLHFQNVNLASKLVTFQAVLKHKVLKKIKSIHKNNVLSIDRIIIGKCVHIVKHYIKK